MTNDYSHSNETLKDISPGSNFFVPIYSYKNDSQIRAVLWFLDTHDRGCLDVKEGYGCIEPK